jgi:hypothetical protein
VLKFSALAKHFNAVIEAWNRGERTDAYDENGRSRMVQLWESVRRERGEDEADLSVVAYVINNDIPLKRR